MDIRESVKSKRLKKVSVQATYIDFGNEIINLRVTEEKSPTVWHKTIESIAWLYKADLSCKSQIIDIFRQDDLL